MKAIAKLKEKGVKYRLIELSDRAVSVDDVVKFSKGELKRDEICKTLIVKDSEGKRYAIFLLGDAKIDFSKVKDLVGKKVSLASFDEVKEETGVEPGAVCPLVLNIPIFADKRVFEKKNINFGSGDQLFGIEVASKDLDKVIEFKVVDVAQD